MRKSINLLGVLLVQSLFCVTVSTADVTLPSVISDNMVLQSGTNAPIWGWAEPSEKVYVKGDWQSSGVSTKADSTGKWKLAISSPKPGKSYKITIKGNNTITIDNVLAGEVWLCSGQSNMQWSVNKSVNPIAEIAAANYPEIRLFTVAQKVAKNPQSDCKGQWVVCSPKTIAGFSAVAYYFGRELHNKLKTPIGLLHTSWGGTPAEAWTSREVLAADPDFQPILTRFAKAAENWPQTRKKWKKQLEEWTETERTAKAQGKIPPRKPREPFGPGHRNSPSGLYNAMLTPLMPYTIRGAIWYQGEANCTRAYQYRKLFAAMIGNWRRSWGQGNFPFYFVQIAPFNYGRGSGPRAAELREAQMLTLSLPNTGMAVTMDIGNPTNIHPKNKQDVGKRLALWALAKTYGHKDIAYSGPLYKSAKVEGDKIRVFFDHTATGLLAKEGPLTHFTIAAEDRQFIAATAVIDSDTVVVSSDQIKNPVAVRYAWSNAAEPNLFNSAKLPASSFRTDDWPLSTAANR